MNKLTLIFIAGALAVSAGLAIAQSKMTKDSFMPGHDMPGHSMPASENRPTNAQAGSGDRMHKGMMVEPTGDW